MSLRFGGRRGRDALGRRVFRRYEFLLGFFLPGFLLGGALVAAGIGSVVAVDFAAGSAGTAAGAAAVEVPRSKLDWLAHPASNAPSTAMMTWRMTAPLSP